MKVNLGPYRYDLIPIGRWEGAYERMRGSNGLYLLEEDYTWYDKIVMGFFDKLNGLVRPLNMWYCDRKRIEKVHVDDYDVWGADHTLALIIHPVLVRLKEKKQGSPCVDDEDVPDQLMSTVAPPKMFEWDTDANHHARWEWVLDEMIWAFEQHTDPDRNDNQFYHNSDQLDMTFESTGETTLGGKGMKTLKFNHQKNPSKPAYWVDKEGLKVHYERIANGRRLFAKYYDGLWD